MTSQQVSLPRVVALAQWLEQWSYTPETLYEIAMGPKFESWMR